MLTAVCGDSGGKIGTISFLFYMIKMENARLSGFIDGPEGTKSIHKQVLLVAESSSSGVAC